RQHANWAVTCARCPMQLFVRVPSGGNHRTRGVTMNIGEEICGEWLRHMKGCDFVQYNVRTTPVQGEIDVVGINLEKHAVYACEVAVHLVTGLQYVKANQPDNVSRLTAKL